MIDGQAFQWSAAWFRSAPPLLPNAPSFGFSGLARVPVRSWMFQPALPSVLPIRLWPSELNWPTASLMLGVRRVCSHSNNAVDDRQVAGGTIVEEPVARVVARNGDVGETHAAATKHVNPIAIPARIARSGDIHQRGSSANIDASARCVIDLRPPGGSIARQRHDPSG